MSKSELITVDAIQNRIYTVRQLQVIIDEDLASFYRIETFNLNKAVKRNISRFPEEFMFQLTKAEYEALTFQFGISKAQGRGGRRYLPYAFTEQGVAMLSAVLKSDTAVRMSVQIINAFVAMRRFLFANAQVFQRLDTLEIKQLETDKKLNKVLTAIESKEIQPKQGIFYDGQIFDAWQFVSDLVRSAQKSIVLIDNYVDDTVLSLFAKRGKEISLTILTKNISRLSEQDVKKFNDQYQPVILRQFSLSHDRFLIIDDSDLYHFGASLKDLGKKWFAFSKMDMNAVKMLEKVKLV